jgi:hypothetical protein
LGVHEICPGNGCAAHIPTATNGYTVTATSGHADGIADSTTAIITDTDTDTDTVTTGDSDTDSASTPITDTAITGDSDTDSATAPITDTAITGDSDTDSATAPITDTDTAGDSDTDSATTADTDTDSATTADTDTDSATTADADPAGANETSMQCSGYQADFDKFEQSKVSGSVLYSTLFSSSLFYRCLCSQQSELGDMFSLCSCRAASRWRPQGATPFC